MMLPGVVTMIPIYLLWNKLALHGPGTFLLHSSPNQYPLWAREPLRQRRSTSSC